ncbi:hypothetical protein F4808DRAFT_465286 [Astrocystis sublimbata]|nr:hypothetical protein F4808DRAFT_465286 [Astrocystis sublimbata]
MYLLAKASDQLLTQYDVITPLMQYRYDEEFRHKIELAIVALLKDIWDGAEKICQIKKWQITTVSLSIPSQWTLEFEEKYRDLAVQAWDIAPSSIIFVTEAEALAHCAWYDRTDDCDLRNQAGNTNAEIILLLDFGGHNSNSCILKISELGGNNASFFLMDRPEGKFNSSKLQPDGARDFNWYILGRDGQHKRVMVPAALVLKTFEQALRLPMKTAEDRIVTAAELSDCQARVLVAGGTSKSRYLQQKIKECCAANGLREPLFLETLGTPGFTARISEGAAYAVAHAPSVDEFLSRGAGFGIQMLQRRSADASGTIWDNEALFMYTNGHPSATVQLELTGHDELKLLCDPFFNRDPSRLYYNDCYDLLYLGRLPKGRWTFGLFFEQSEGETSLLLKFAYRKLRSNGHNTRCDITISLYMRLGARTLHPGFPDQDQDKITGQLPQMFRSLA